LSGVRFPDGFRIEPLCREHPRKSFRSGQTEVDDWLATKALQNQEKHLSVTRVLLDESDSLAGYYTLATGEVDFTDLPPEAVRRLPRRRLPVAVLAWLGVDRAFQGQGLGRRFLAQALRDCHEAGRTFPFIAVVLDCIDEKAKTFYRKFDFQELPGHANRMFLGTQSLELMATHYPHPPGP
jgi:GNAT superfamily N-acetyltransferase